MANSSIHMVKLFGSVNTHQCDKSKTPPTFDEKVGVTVQFIEQFDKNSQSTMNIYKHTNQFFFSFPKHCGPKYCTTEN